MAGRYYWTAQTNMAIDTYNKEAVDASYYSPVYTRLIFDTWKLKNEVRAGQWRQR